MSYSSTILGTSGLIAFWPFGESVGSSSVVDLVGSYSATISGTVTLGQPSLVFGGDTSANLDGATGYATVASGNESVFRFTNTQAWSVEFWVNPNVTRSGSDTFHCIYSKFDGTIGQRIYLYWRSASGKTFIYVANQASTTAIEVYGSTDLTNGALWHVVITYDGSNSASGLKIYVNSALQNNTVLTNTLAGTTSNTTNPRFGANSNSTINYANAILDDISIYSVALSVSTITSHYLAGIISYISPYGTKIANLSNLISYYKLDETSGTTAADSKGSTNLTYSGAYQQGLVGIDNTAVRFDGASGKVGSSSSSPTTSRTSVSIECWFHFQSYVTQRQVIFNVGDPATDGYAMIVNGWNGSAYTTDGSLYLLHNNIAWYYVNVAVLPGWHHVVLIYDASNHPTVYYDGVSVYSSSNAPVAPSAKFFIGSDGSSWFFNGLIDEVSVWNAALTATNVIDHYKTVFSRPSPKFLRAPVSVRKTSKKLKCLMYPRTGVNCFDAISRRNGTLSNTTTYPSLTTSPWGNSLRWVTVGSQNIAFPGSGYIIPPPTVTIFCIARFDDVTVDQRPVYSATTGGFSLRVTSDVRIDFTGATFVQSGITLNNNTWYIIAASITFGSSIKFWVYDYDYGILRVNTVSTTFLLAGINLGDSSASANINATVGDVVLGGLSDGVWTDNDFARFVADPFYLVRPTSFNRLASIAAASNITSVSRRQFGPRVGKRQLQD